MVTEDQQLRRYHPDKHSLKFWTFSVTFTLTTTEQLVSSLVGALSPVNHKRFHHGWIQTSLYLQVIHFTSHHPTSNMFWAYLYSTGTQHGNLHPAGWPILFCRPTQEPCVSHSQHRRNWEIWGKNAGERTTRVEISKEEIPGSSSMHGYMLTYSRL